MPTKKESTASAVKETKTTKTAARKTTASATKTKAASETAKKSAAAVKKSEAESAPAVAKEKKKNTVRAQKASAKTVTKAKSEEIKAEAAKVEEAAEAPKKKAEPKKTAKAAAKTAAKEEPAKAEVKAEAPKAEAKAEVKKEEPAKEAKAEVKEPAKTAVIKRPKAELAKTETEAEKPAEEAKPKAKKAPAKKAAAKKAEPAKATVKEEKPVEEAKKAEPAKEEKPVKAEAKPAAKAEAKPAKKAAAKKAEPAKEEKPAKAEAKKAEVKEEKPVETVTETVVEEAPAAKPAVELTEEKLQAYRAFPLETLLEMTNAAGLTRSLDELKNDLANTLDVDSYVTNAVLEALNSGNELSFEDDGYDVSVIPVVMETIYESLPYKASDATDLEKQVHEALELNLTDDGMKNADVYNKLMDLERQILEVGQKQNMNTLEQVNTVIPGDLRKVTEHFMDVAYDLLPYWSYDDVKFYEGFIYAVISQFDDLKDLENRAMMDVADLYIKHGDYGRGDAEYNYVIRENQLKDQIYYRFANVYRNFDPQKAKSIAASALQYVDGRYDYYPRIMEILNS